MRSRRWWRSVRARVTATATAAVALALAAAVLGLTHTVQNTLIGRASDEAEARVEAVAARLEAGVSPADALDSHRQVFGEVPPTPVHIMNADGDILAASPGVVDLRAVAPAPLLAGPQVNVIEIGPSELAIATRSAVVDGEHVSVVAVSPLAEAARSVAAILRASAIGAPLLLLLVAAVTWRATGRTLRPINEMRTEVDELSSTTLSRRVPVPSTGDEVALLAQTMNTMLARLEEAHLRQEAFVSDASHELRSPVATIRTQLEVALAHPDSGDWRAVASDVLDEAGRMERLIGDLLLLARLDQGVPPATKIVLLTDVIAAVVGRSDDDRLCVRTSGSLPVRGRSTQLEIAIGNLVDNARRHARSQVEIRGETHEERVVVLVSDDGPGIPHAERRRVFERFTRLDESRSRMDGGIGLGLAVAQRVVEHHGGLLSIDDCGLGGAQFRIELPAALP